MPLDATPLPFILFYPVAGIVHDSGAHGVSLSFCPSENSNGTKAGWNDTTVEVEVTGMSNISKYTLFNVVATLRNCWRQVALVPLNSVIIYYSDTESPKARKLAREKRMGRGKGTDDARLNAPWRHRAPSKRKIAWYIIIKNSYLLLTFL